MMKIRQVIITVVVGLALLPGFTLAQMGHGPRMGMKGSMAPDSDAMKQMQDMMEQMGGMMHQMSEHMQAGQLTPEQTKQMGEMMGQMSETMGNISTMLGDSGPDSGRSHGRRMGYGTMTSMSDMMKQMTEIHKRMSGWNIRMNQRLSPLPRQRRSKTVASGADLRLWPGLAHWGEGLGHVTAQEDQRD